MDLSQITGGFRGGVAFLTRLPVETSEHDWRRFQRFPAAFPLVGYLVGAVTALSFLLFSGTTAAFVYLLALLAIAGVVHFDGVADLGDAAVLCDPDDRHSALKDTTTGVGGVTAVAVVVAGLALAGLALTALPSRSAMAIVVAAEVGAKLGMATVACLGAASHEGMGSGFTERTEPRLLVGPVIAAVPAVLLTSGSPAGLAAVAVGPVVAVAAVAWADRALGGVSGDVFGAVNELARVIALHAGVIVWMRF